MRGGQAERGRTDRAKHGPRGASAQNPRAGKVRDDERELAERRTRARVEAQSTTNGASSLVTGKEEGWTESTIERSGLSGVE